MRYDRVESSACIEIILLSHHRFIPPPSPLTFLSTLLPPFLHFFLSSSLPTHLPFSFSSSLPPSLPLFFASYLLPFFLPTSFPSFPLQVVQADVHSKIMHALGERDILHQGNVRITQEQYARQMANLREEQLNDRRRSASSMR